MSNEPDCTVAVCDGIPLYRIAIIPQLIDPCTLDLVMLFLMFKLTDRPKSHERKQQMISAGSGKRHKGIVWGLNTCCTSYAHSQSFRRASDLETVRLAGQHPNAI